MSDTNYKAIVFTIKNTRPIEKADRLLATNIYGNNVIIGIDTKIGDKGLYFPLESQIGLEFAQKNDLIRRKDPITGKLAGGMFDTNRRVRAQVFRGEKSMGFWIPIESLKKLEQGFDTQIENLKDGDEVAEFNGYSISTKYVPNIQRTDAENTSNKSQKRGKRVSKVIEGQFRFHKDTAQLGKNIHNISPDDLIAITYKYHGTSAIAARVLVNDKLSWKLKLSTWFAKILGLNPTNHKYDYLYASRSVVKNEFEQDKKHYYGEDLWTEVGKRYFEGGLKTGETIYYEIVGYTDSGKEIQKGYNYGCHHNGIEGTTYTMCPNEAIVYRITYTLPDNTVVELPWPQLEERCKELGVKSALLLYYGRASGHPTKIEPGNKTKEQWQEDFLKTLQDIYLEKDCIFHGKGVPAEGICVRKEGLNLVTYKLKSFRFLEGETKALDQGEVDLETQQSETNGEVQL